ncbi:MAG: anti-sigma F factor [Ruminiclostridium sp.]|nr:anti-sigma F factor [Ruminiclostridium sp.]
MKYINYFKMTIPSLSRNESFARTVVSAFVSQLDPLVSQLADIRAAVSEAVTNCIVHAYADSEDAGKITITAKLSEDTAYIKIKDNGCGIENIKQAMEPLFTTKPDEERTGLGFAVMESCADKVKVSSEKNKGTTVNLTFKIETKEVL